MMHAYCMHFFTIAQLVTTQYWCTGFYLGSRGGYIDL